MINLFLQRTNSPTTLVNSPFYSLVNIIYGKFRWERLRKRLKYFSGLYFQRTPTYKRRIKDAQGGFLRNLGGGGFPALIPTIHYSANTDKWYQLPELLRKGSVPYQKPQGKDVSQLIKEVGKLNDWAC